MSSKSSKSSKTREIVHGHDLDNLDNLCKKDYIKLLDNLCLDYYNGTGYVDDETYDSAKEMFEIKFGELYEKIGAPVVGSQQKKKLPKFMGSLNKIKDRKIDIYSISDYPDAFAEYGDRIKGRIAKNDYMQIEEIINKSNKLISPTEKAS